MLKGILCCMSANFLFGLGYYFAILLRPLSGESMFGYRIFVLAPFILLAIILFKQADKFSELLQKIRQNPPLVLLIALLAFIQGFQLWLFLWAPNNGQAIEVSIGYLLLPIVAVALGKRVFKERFTTLKWLAIGFAVLGVCSNIWLAGTFSWATLAAGVGYPIYITLRRYFQINNLTTFFVELLFIMPFAAYFAMQTNVDEMVAQNPFLFYFLALFGIVNGAAFILYIASSNMLPVNVLGMLGYVEPLVMLFISFAIGEVLEAKSYLLMICLAFAIGLLTLDSFRRK